MFDSTGAAPIPDAVVLVEGDRIAAVGPRSKVKIPRNTAVVDVSGRFITPGLIDAHVHFFQSGGVATRPDIADLRDVHPYAEEQAALRARLDDTFRRTLASGVTAVVDMGGPFWNFEVRDRARSAPEGAAPRVAVTGPLLSSVDRPQLDLGDAPIRKAATPEEARAQVQAQLPHHPDFIKIWFIPDKEKGVEPVVPLVQAAVDEAHRAGLRVAVHATGLAEARASVELGADILVHSIDDQPVDPALLALMKEKGTVYIPNLVVLQGYADVFAARVHLTELEQKYGDPTVIGSWAEFPVLAPGRVPPEKTAARLARFEVAGPIMRQNLRAVAEAGIPLAAGTDAGNIGTLHGPSLVHELSLLVEAGLTPTQALTAATSGSARVFAAKPDIGTLAPGRKADLLVLDADPLQDIANLGRLRTVVKGGVAVSPDTLVPPNPDWVVDRQVEAYNARDLDAFVSWYAEDARVVRDGTNEILAADRASLRKVYGDLFAASPALTCHVMERQVSGTRVVDHELVTGLRAGPAVRAVAVYRVEGGLIREVRLLPKE